MFNSEYFSKAMEKVGRRYLIVNLVSIRVRQLHEGAEPLLEKYDNMNYVDIALKEIIDGLIEVKKEEQDVVDIFG